MTAHHLTWELERCVDADGDPTYVGVTVAYRFSPGRAARINCDPNDGWDADPAEVEIDDVIGSDGKAMAVTDAERKATEDYILDHPPYLDPDPDDARDRMIEDREFFAGGYGDD